MKKTKKTLLTSALSLFLCFAMLTGTTFAWFTDTVTSKSNVIQSGSLDAEMYWSDDLLAVDSTEWKNADGVPIFNHKNWEPGYTEVKYIKVKNAGNLSFKWQITIEPEGEVGKLAEVIDVYYVNPVENKLTSLDGLTSKGVLSDVIKNRTATSGVLLPEGETSTEQPVYETVIAIAFHMQESAGNDYQTESVGAGFSVKLIATQYSYENDAFGDEYDTGVEFPAPIGDASVSTNVTPDANNKVPAGGATLDGGTIGATVPAGVQLEQGVNKLTLSVSNIENSNANLTLGDNEIQSSLDVHIAGVASDNTVPMEITLIEKAPKGMNLGNLKIYHVENGVTNEMTYVAQDAAFTAHNQFKYDPATGNIVLYMATFSEIAVVADTVNPWEGKFDDSWYTNAVAPVAEGDPDYVIANADQLAAFGAIVGGMKFTVDGDSKQYDADSFSGQTIKLVADINLGDKESENKPNIIFYPIGYYNDEGTYEKSNKKISSGFKTFEGTFDGNGNTISNFYQNTWEMKGDHDWYDATLQYYRDGMGLFGKVYGGTVKNLTVSNFSSDGEITTTGVIAAYADGATFENIAIFNCNPRVYNIGNGGIVGCVGWYAKEVGLKTTFTNITVDNSNKISALWGSYDVACGGIVGQYYPTSGQTSAGTPKNGGIDLVNCHVSAQMDVYNDVCGNYQYYAYRYAGMIIGSIRENTTNEDGKTIPDMTGISATGCTVNYGDWNDYYYCEFEKNGHPSYSGPDDYKFSRVPHSELNFTDSNGNGLVDANERDSVTGCKHDHTDAENNPAIYLPFHQLFTGYGWGVNSIGLEKYSGIVTNLDITEGDQEESVEKFETKFTGDFLYRVGNKNTVSLGSLFAAKDGVTISNSGVWVKVEKLDENMNVSGNFDPNTNNWTEGTIQFSGTGVVKVTIQDYNFCTPTELYLEVVDATNLTSATGTTTGGNFVLLCDVNTATYVNYWNCTLYGNGFTYSLKGAPTAYNSKQGHGILITKNATLDNIVIVGDVYNKYGAFSQNDYYNTAVDVLENTTIQNCYISGCSAPVRARNNVTIKDTTLYGGAVGNLIIMAGTATLENVTTVNYDDGRELVGMGIVIHSDTVSAKLVLNGTLTQYNFMSENKEPSDSYAKSLHSAMFSSSCSKYQFGSSPNRYVNTGIISLTSNFGKDHIVDNTGNGYLGQNVTLNNNDGYVYTQPNTIGSVNNNYDLINDPHKSKVQGFIEPNYKFDHTINYQESVEGSNDSCSFNEDIQKVILSFDQGSSKNYNPNILVLTKYGKTVEYTVKMNGQDYTDKNITFNATGDYTIVYTYEDIDNYFINENGVLETRTITYTKNLYVSVKAVAPTIKPPQFTFYGYNSESTTPSTTITNTTQITIDGKVYVMPVNGSANTVSTTINGQTVNCPVVYVGFKDNSSDFSWLYPIFLGLKIVDNNITVVDKTSTSKPSSITILTADKPSGAVGWSSGSGNSGSEGKIGSGTYKNLYGWTSGTIGSDKSEDNIYGQFSYEASNGTIYYYVIAFRRPEHKCPSCVTPDTLITLADGTQVRVDSLTGNEELLVWNMETGKLDKAPIMFVDSDAEAEYEIIHLYFSDGTDVKVIYEHGFWDYDLNKYVYLDRNAADYIGHTFAKQNGDSLEKVELVDVVIETEVTTAWSPVTEGHLCYFVNGMLSMPGGVGGLFNIFEVDPETMTYDLEAMQKDIETYGLYTYEELNAICPLSEEMFNAAGGAYLKISIGKGNLTMDELIYMIQRYSVYFN